MADPDGTLLTEPTLTENGRGAQVYLGSTQIRQLVCPLTPGTTIVAQTIPHTGILLLPSEPSYPLDLTIRDPAQSANQLETQPDHAP